MPPEKVHVENLRYFHINLEIITEFEDFEAQAVKREEIYWILNKLI